MDQETLEYLGKIRRDHIDSTIDDPRYQRFVEFLQPYLIDEHIARHSIRFSNTFRSMVRHELPLDHQRICETGELSLISKFLAVDGDNKVWPTQSDLRYRIEWADEQFDLILSLEVIEHIKDQAERTLDEVVLFSGSGVRAYASEITRILKPGAHLVLTTPNPCSALALRRILDFVAPSVYRPHVREYSRSEMEEIFGSLKLVAYESHFSFYFLGGELDAELRRILSYDVTERGDDHFFIWRKPR
jgi:SAM-dependent methyltransferase